MKKQSMALMGVALIAAIIFLPTLAYAGSPLRGISRGGIRTPRISSSLSRSRNSLGSLSGLSRSARNLGGSSLFQSGSNHSKWNASDLFRNSRNYPSFNNHGGYGWNNHHYSDHNDRADAYRDVGIANAVVGLVGIMANVATAPRYTYAAPPAPAPSGYWARQAVVVQPEHYEQYQVWIPEVYDSRTGVKTGGGYYETHSRLVPQVVEYQNVWVAP